MNADEIYKVIKKLVGPIEPVADTAIDNKRAENLQVLLKVFDKIHTDVDDIAYRNKDTKFLSVERMVNLCNDQLDKMGIKEEQEGRTVLLELKCKILENFESFEKLLREHFDFWHLKSLHNDKLDFSCVHLYGDYICITLHDCAEIQDEIFIGINSKGSFNKKLVWEGVTLFMEQVIDGMD